MNTRAASVACLLAGIVLSVDARAAVSQVAETALSAAVFMDACGEAARERPQKYFTPATSIGDPKRPVKVFTLRPEFTAHVNIAAMVQKGPDTDVEVPRITSVCENNVPQPSMYGGNIQFPSKPGDFITVRFHLLDLVHTTWKPAANDSVWMVEGLTKYPNATDWPACMQPKTVHGGGTGKDIWFKMCSNATVIDNLYYRYELVLVQTSKDGAWVDVGIDPQIINHPH